MKAVVQIGNSQYLVEPGQNILVDRLPDKEGKLVIKEVMLVLDGDRILIGQPYLDHAVVKAEIKGDAQGEKIRVEKYKAKSKYHKVTGSRSKLSKVTIEEIVAK